MLKQGQSSHQQRSKHPRWGSAAGAPL